MSLVNRVVVFLGPPGCGKGTQGAILAEKLNIHHIIVGNLLREYSNSSTSLGMQVKSIIESGRLVPSYLVNELFIDKFNSYKNGIIIDGYPRDWEQAEFLNKNLKDLLVIFFNISEDMLIKRITGRYTCVNCGKIYNVYYASTKVKNICDQCEASQFNRRKDDDINIFKKRIDEYKTKTLPVVNYYRGINVLKEIDASKSMDVITQDIMNIINN